MTRLYGTAILAATLASCAPAPETAAARGPAPEAWTAASPAGEIATWAWSGCGGRVECVERTLTALIDPAGVGKAMETLDTLVARHGAVRENAHALAHGLGISAYRSPATLAATFAECTPSQMSGCYHGVIQGYFLAALREGGRVGTAELDALCEPHRASAFLHFQCVHGMGHGLMALHGNHLPRALAACDLATEPAVRENCYGGAFMENIVLVTHPHHTAEGHAGTQGHGHGHGAEGHGAHAEHDEHAGHDAHAGHGAADAGPWRPLDRSRPLYPCTEVDERYHAACYNMQSSAILFFNGGDVRATARACEGAPEAMVAVCIGSLGRDITALAAQDHRRSAELCRRSAGASGGRVEEWCVTAVAQNLVNLAAEPEEGLRFCRVVGAVENKRACYRAVGASIASLVADPEARSARCDGAEPGFAAACRAGAGTGPETGG